MKLIFYDKYFYNKFTLIRNFNVCSIDNFFIINKYQLKKFTWSIIFCTIINVII